jgi:hypothetical protein
VWEKAIGNELGLSETSYTAALRRAQALETTIRRGSQLSADEAMKKSWLDKIEHDVRQTYPELKIFQPDGPLHSSLLDILNAYAMYRSDVGYVHGTSVSISFPPNFNTRPLTLLETIAALLLLNLPTPSAAFCALSNILNRPIPLSFHTSDSGATSRTYSLLLSTLKTKSPRLHQHLTSAQLNLQHDIYSKGIFTSLFTECLSLDNATRLWDVMVFEGDSVLIRGCVAFLTAMEGKLFGAESARQVYDIVREGLDHLGEEEWMKYVKDAGRS